MSRSILVFGLLALLAGLVGLSLFGVPTSDEPTRAGEVELDLRAVVEGVDSPSAPSRASRVDPEAAPAPVDLSRADRDLDLHGIVVDEGGAPIAGADVVTVRHPGRRVRVFDHEAFDEEQEGPRTRSSIDGTFSIRLLQGSLVELRVSAAGVLDGGRRRLPGRRAGASGARAGDGAASGGDRRRAGRARGGRAAAVLAPRCLRQLRSSTGVTDAGGRYVFEGIGSGEGRLILEHDRLGSPPPQSIDLAANETTTLEVTMPTGQEIRGRVIDATTGAPIAGARVVSALVFIAPLGGSDRLNRAVETDDAGRYLFHGFLAHPSHHGKHTLDVIAEGYERREEVVPTRGELDFQLTPGDEARGRLLGADGAPVPGARVTAVGRIWKRSGPQDDSRSTRSEPDGSFHLTSLRRDVDHALVVRAQGYGRYHLNLPRIRMSPGSSTWVM